MLSATSRATAAISTASTPSEIRSPAAGADDAHAQNPLRLWLDDQFGQSVGAGVADGFAEAARGILAR